MNLFVVNSDGSRSELFVPSDFEPDFEYKNAAVEFDQIPGALSFNQKIPIEGNAKTLQQAHHVATRIGDVIFDLEGFVGGELRVRGKLLVDGDSWNSSDDHYQVSLIATDFSSAIEGQTLKGLLANTEIDLTAGQPTLMDGILVSLADPNAPLKYPSYFNAKHFGEGVNPAFEGVLNEFNGSIFQYLQNASTPEGSYYENKHSFAPWIRLYYVIEKIFEAAGYQLQSDLDTRDFGKVIQYGGFSIDYFEDTELMIVGAGTGPTNSYIAWIVLIESTQTTPTVVPTINPYVIESEGLLQVNLQLAVGNCDTPTFDLAIDLNGAPTALQWTNLEPNTVHQLQHTFDSTGFLGDVLSIRINPLGSSTIDVLSGTTLTIKDLTQSSRMRYYETVSAARILPQMGVAEYLLAVRKYFNLKFTLNPVTRIAQMEHCTDALERPFQKLAGVVGSAQVTKSRRPAKVTMKLVNEAPEFDAERFDGAVNTFSDLNFPLIGKVMKVNSTGAIYRYQLNEETNTFEWAELGKADLSESWGEGQEQIIEIPCELVTMKNETTVSGRALMPYFDEEGISDAYNPNGEQAILRFAIWHGLQPTSLGINYPLASPHNYNGQGTELDTFSLELSDNPSSVFMVLHTEWLPVIFAQKTIEKEYVGKIDPYQVTNRPLLIDNQLFIVESVVKVESQISERAVLKLRLL